MSLSGARPTVTISLGRATIRPANGPDSNVSIAAKPAPAAIASGGTACSETVRLESVESVGCHAGMMEVASSNPSGWDEGVPFPDWPGAVPDGQRIMVDDTDSVPAVCGVW